MILFLSLTGFIVSVYAVALNVGGETLSQSTPSTALDSTNEPNSEIPTLPSSYSIRRLYDGRYWMIDNLQLAKPV